MTRTSTPTTEAPLTREIEVHGYLTVVSAATAELAATADLVVAPRRVLDDLLVPEHRRVVLGALTPALARIEQSVTTDRVLVIASGDPCFHGIVRRLRLAGHHVRVTPAVSSVAAAFAAVALPWDDAVVVSAHGRAIDEAVQAAQRHRKVAVLTAAGTGLPELARELPTRTFVLAERLGGPQQRVRVLTADQALAVDDLVEPNVVLVLAGSPDDPALIDVESTHDEPSAELSSAPNATPVIGQLTGSPAARRRADEIDQALQITSVRFDGPATAQLPLAWAECDLIISHLALGGTTRLLAPLLANKKTDPGVVVVDEAGRFAVPVVGGHAGGANDLARRIADGIGATAVITTATDALDLPALDTLGWPYQGDVAGVTRALIDGRPVLVTKTSGWPLPPWPENVSESAADPVAQILVSDLLSPPASSLPTVTLRPPSLVVGMGCNRGTSVEALRELFTATLAEAGLAPSSVSAITTVDLKAGELGLLKLVHELGVPLIDFTADELARQKVPTPSELVQGHVGTPSVAEASVLARGAELIVPKQRSSEATCAIGRIPARGRLSVVGLGPGSRDLLTPRAIDALRSATLIVGYGPYVRQIRDLARPGTRIYASKMGTEEARTAAAIEAARGGENVALVCGGDPAIYAMASPVLEQGTEGIDVQIVPGVTASLAVSAILGAPLGHDHATISLSDLHTDWAMIERRVQAAADGDLVVALYNPRSRTRTWQLPRALEIIGAQRRPDTPIAVVQQACRSREKVLMSTLAEFQPEWVDMNSLVVVGSTTTRYVTTGGGEQRMVTPRDYSWMGGLQLDGGLQLGGRDPHEQQNTKEHQ